MIIILDREEPDPRAVQRGANNKNMNMKQEGPFLGRRIIMNIIIVKLQICSNKSNGNFLIFDTYDFSTSITVI